MKTRLVNLVITIRASYWAIPLAGLVLAVLLAIVTALSDHLYFSGQATLGPPWLGVGDLDVVRTLLATVGSAIVGVMGLAFSITITSLVLASSQLGPRLLRTYMDRRFVQFVLALLSGTSLFCFLQLYLSNIWERLEIEPVSTVTLLLVLVVANLVLLVFFVHHSAVYLQADTVIADVHESFGNRLHLWYPSERSDIPKYLPERNAEQIARLFDKPLLELPAPQSGYLGDIDIDSLVAFAASRHLIIQLHRQPGDYLIRHSRVGTVVTDAVPIGSDDHDTRLAELKEEFLVQLMRSCVIENSRSTESDPRYMIRQLIEIGTRALSPGINDPYTAITCLDRLTSALRAVAARADRRLQHFDENGHLRVIETFTSRADLVGYAYDQIRQAAGSRPDVLLHLLNSMTELAYAVDEKDFHQAIAAQVEMIEDQLESGENTRRERNELDRCIDRIRSMIDAEGEHSLIRFG